jgi:hypothetical protein
LVATAVESASQREGSVSAAARRPSLPEAWHLLSLDAPTIAALWACFFARTVDIHLPWHAPLILAIGTWLIYVADRILDGFRKFPTVALHRRHHFHTQHRKGFLFAAVVAGAALLSLIVGRMPAKARSEDMVLFVIALVYLYLVHGPRTNRKAWLPKELAVGTVFAAATAVPAWSRLASGRAELLPGIAVFSVLCWLNCVAIECWESGSDRMQRNDASNCIAVPHITTRWAVNNLETTALLTAIVSLFVWIGARMAVLSTAPIYLAAFVSAFCFAVLDRHRQRFSTLHLRIAADLFLLSPILLLLVVGNS